MPPARAVGGETLDPERVVIGVLRHIRDAFVDHLAQHVHHLRRIVDQSRLQQRPVGGRVAADPPDVFAEALHIDDLRIRRVAAHRLAPRLERELFQRGGNLRPAPRLHIADHRQIDPRPRFRHRETGAVKTAVADFISPVEFDLRVIQHAPVKFFLCGGAFLLRKLAVAQVQRDPQQPVESAGEHVQHRRLDLHRVEFRITPVVLPILRLQLCQIPERTVAVQLRQQLRAGAFVRQIQPRRCFGQLPFHVQHRVPLLRGIRPRQQSGTQRQSDHTNPFHCDILLHSTSGAL